MLDWEETDRFSFEDSDRFEEDSLCSWSSEPESLCNNWRGWKRPTLGSATFGTSKRASDGSGVPSLGELTARCVAAHIPFELVEHVYPPVPEQLQLQIAFWSFPDNEEDIRLYSCLANGSADEFQRGEHLFKNKTVKEPLQIGFHLSASVCPPPSVGQSRGLYNVAVTFDRRRITSCNCTCMSPAYWCSHVVAVCLHRIHLPTQVCLRAPVSESLSRLHREQLQKFAQYLISELPQQILPTAQRLLDELLSPQSTAINSVCGAPDPTAGASANDQTSWYLDEKTLHDNIKKILIKFCVPAPIVFSDVNYLSTTAPPAAAEWSSLLRPLRGREPEGMWNLLSIVREMFKRNDRNAIPLLEIITQECMACEQILVWWVNTKVALLNGGGHGAGKHSSVNSNSHASQHACSSLCDEIVVLWRLAALNPGLGPEERSQLQQLFTAWHIKIVDKVTKSRGVSANPALPANAKNMLSFRHDVEVFTGFKPALEACYLDWEDYPIAGITYTPGSSRLYHCPFTCFRHSGDAKPEVNQVNSSQAVLNRETVTSAHHHTRHCPTGLTKRPARISGLVEFSYRDRRLLSRHDFPSLCTVPLGARERDGNRSSVSSEGFCENETDAPDADLLIAERLMNRPMRDSDSQEGGGSDSASSSGASARERVKDKRPKKHEARHKSPMSSVMYEIGSFSDFVNPHSLPGSSKCYQLDTPGPSLPGSSKGAAAKPKSEDAESDISTPESRHPSKDESSSTNSDSQQSGDEYNVYYYDPKARVTHAQDKSKLSKKESGLSPNLFANLKKMEDPWDILFARAEGLHAHGHGKEACSLGVQLAEELLANPPDLMVEIPVPSALAATKGRRKKLLSSACLQVSCLASATLAKCGFLCTLLAESLQHFNLAFRVGLFGLELARPPASTKPLEVKLANQECELVSLLKRIPLGSWEIGIIRDRAHQLKGGTLGSRGEALLPIMLASFLFDALLMPAAPREPHSRCQVSSPALRLPTDEELGFEAAVAALGLKANVSEADHPLLCEGTRRQRGDLAITLLVHYKDDANKVARIMDKLLDREVHQLIKTPILGSYYCHSASKHSLAARKKEETARLDKQAQQAVNLPVFPVGGGGPSGGVGEHEALTLNTQSSVPQVSRNKDARFKGKRVFPSIPNQPSEAGAHFMFELAKTVLTKAGGNSSTSLFTQASTNQNHHGPHRALHICAFQIGLYALGLHNCVSPNWLSRTYSSHVSWITGQAMEIGAPAISFLIDTWEGHLTPPEAVSIADRASRGCDPNIVRAAAELALSCLPHSHALNPNEIQRAILQCKEQSDLMLEHSCLTVENAAKGGGVYPEVLFQVARYWYELYVRHTPGGEQPMDDNAHDSTNPMDPNASLVALVETNAGMDLPPPPPTVVVTTAPPHYQTHPYTVPYSFAVQGVGVGVHPHLPFTPRVSLPPPHLQMFLSPPTFQYPPHTANQAYVNLSANQNAGNQTYVNLSANQNPGNQTYVNLSANQNPGNQTFVNLSTSQGASNQAFVNLSTSQSPATPTFVNLANQNGGNQAYVNLTTNQGGSNPTYVNLSANQGSAAPTYVNLSANQSSAAPTYVNLSANQGSAAPTYVNLSANQGSATPTYVNLSTNQQGSPAPTYVNLSTNQNSGNQGYVNQGSMAPMQYYGAVTIAPSRAAAVVATGNAGGHHHVYPIATMQPGPPIQVHRQPQPFSQVQLRYLLAAYRVGMLALETLARRVHDDRPQAKYARNPPYGEDVKWLLRVGKKLGSQYLHQFCVCAVNSIVSPFVLHDVALEAAHYLSRNNPGLIIQHLRSALTPLVQKCQQMYIQCMHQKLYHLTSSDYEDFVNIVMSARAAFQITPEGNTQFKEWLQSIRRSKSCKKDLWTQINAALQANSK